VRKRNQIQSVDIDCKSKGLQGKVSPANAEIVNIGQVKELFYSLEGNRGDFSSGNGDTLAENGRFGLSWWADSDGDGYSDLEEILHGSDPDDPIDLPSLRLEVVSGNGQQVMLNQVTAPITFAVKRGFSTSADEKRKLIQ